MLFFPLHIYIYAENLCVKYPTITYLSLGLIQCRQTDLLFSILLHSHSE